MDLKFGEGGLFGEASPHGVIMVVAKVPGSDSASVSFKYLDRVVKEQDFIDMAAIVLHELQLRAARAAQAQGKAPISLGRFTDKALDHALDTKRTEGS